MRSALVGASIAAVLAVVAGGLYLYLMAEARTDSFRAMAELRAWALADRVSFELGENGDRQRLAFLVRAFVIPGGNVLYAQVLDGDTPLAEATLLDESIPPPDLTEALFRIDERRVGGHSVWDIQQTLPQSRYAVRVGLSIDTLQASIRGQTVLTIGIGLAIVALTAGVTLMTAPRSRTESRAGPSTDDPHVSASEHDAAIGASMANSEHQIGEVVIDVAAKRVRVRGEPVELSPKEFELLSLLAESPGRVYANDEILQRVWPDNALAGAQDVKQYIYFLRQKLEENPKSPKLIVTVRGFGYKLDPDV